MKQGETEACQRVSQSEAPTNVTTLPVISNFQDQANLMQQQLGKE